MSAIHVSAQELSDIYTSTYCTYAACAIFIYDWLLCLDQELRFIWNWHAGLSIFSLLYALSRYTFLIQNILAVATTYPISDLARRFFSSPLLDGLMVDHVEVIPSRSVTISSCLYAIPYQSCKANGWAQNAFGILGIAAFSAFSALRAYALSNKNRWLTAIIILLALPAPVVEIFLAVNIEFQNLPGPLYCVGSSQLSPTLYNIVYRTMRVSQLGAELLVVIITWWYTYQSYRIRKGVKVGKSISTLIIYNGSIYFLFFIGWYTLDIVISTASVPLQVVRVDSFLELFYDPIVSPFTCRFMLALRQFDSRPAADSKTSPGIDSTAIEFRTPPGDSVPAFVTSFAHPVHVDSFPSETDSDASVDDGTEWREMDVRVPTRSMPSCQSTISTNVRAGLGPPSTFAQSA